ncbi:MAG: hypothetical protein ACRDTD_22665 [Pseudonocardiaceae bacterium]
MIDVPGTQHRQPQRGRATAACVLAAHTIALVESILAHAQPDGAR